MKLHWLDVLKPVMIELDKDFFKDLGVHVISGPFMGMEIPPRLVWQDGNNSGKLLGSYEFELIPSFEKAIARAPDTVINVGCAEGYYTVGLARRLPNAVVYGLDVKVATLAVCRVYADKNGVGGRVIVKEGAKDPKELSCLGRGRHLYVVDCEGSELDLLDPTRCPELLKSDLIIEVHDFLKENISLDLVNRFSPTHDIEVIKPAYPPVFPFLSGLPIILQLLFVTDKRPAGNFWVVAWAKDHGRMEQG